MANQLLMPVKYTLASLLNMGYRREVLPLPLP
jgi:hypothetical protein